MENKEQNEKIVIKLNHYQNYLSKIDGFKQVRDGTLKGILIHFKNENFLRLYKTDKKMLEYAKQFQGLDTYLDENNPSYTICNEVYNVKRKMYEYNYEDGSGEVVTIYEDGAELHFLPNEDGILSSTCYKDANGNEVPVPMVNLSHYPNYLSGIDGFAHAAGGILVHFKNMPFLYLYNYNRRMLGYALQIRGLNTWINENNPPYRIYNGSYIFDSNTNTGGNVIRINSDGNQSEVKEGEIISPPTIKISIKKN